MKSSKKKTIVIEGNFCICINRPCILKETGFIWRNRNISCSKDHIEAKGYKMIDSYSMDNLDRKKYGRKKTIVVSYGWCKCTNNNTCAITNNIRITRCSKRGLIDKGFKVIDEYIPN